MHLTERAMLANLTIHQWTARKQDKAVAAQVEAQHGAKDAGRYNKLLVNKVHLDPIARIAGRIRDYHYERTLPWGDNGDRLLPSTQFFEYTQKIRALKDEFEAHVEQFAQIYPTEVQNARSRLGTMYDPKDYPRDVRDRFGIETSFAPVATAADFRVDIGEEAVAEIKKDITKQLGLRERAALRSCWERLRDTVQKLHDKMLEEKPIFRDSLIENLRELIELLPSLNISNDEGLNSACGAASGLLYGPDRLRQSSSARNDVVRLSAELLKTINVSLEGL